MAADLTPERRAELRALYGASTHRSEPWYADCLIGRGGSAPHSHFIRAGNDEVDDAFVTPMKDGMRPEDVAFCVAAHAVFPALLDLADEADALRAEVERLREGVECHVARPGEGTYECRLDRKCPACRLRDAEAEVERLRELLRQAAPHVGVSSRGEDMALLDRIDDALDERSEG